MKLVGLFMNLAETDSDVPDRKQVFAEGLSGYTEGQNVRLEYRYGAGNYPNYRNLAKELVELRNEGSPPDVIFSGCGPSWRALEAEMAAAHVNIPIVFAGMIDPTPEATLDPRSSHVVTGFISYRANLCKEWPKLLKKMAPSLSRVAILWDPGAALGGTDSPRQLGDTQRRAIEQAAHSLQLDVTEPIDVTLSRQELETKVKNFAAAAPGKSGLIVPGATLTANCRDFIARLARTYGLPAIYANRMYTKSGGLMAYGAKTLKLYKDAAGLVAKVLDHGHVSGPEHRPDFELVINKTTADAMGLPIPNDLPYRPDIIT